MNELLNEMKQNSNVEKSSNFEKLKPKYLSFLEDMVNDFDYTEVDGFADMYKVSDSDMRKLMNLKVKVTL